MSTKFAPATSSATTSSVPQEVEKAWGEIIETVDKILKIHVKFGFDGFDKNIHPSIEDIIFSLRVVESLLDILYNSEKLSYSEQRLIFNSKQQILFIQEIAEALKNKDEDGYQSTIVRLRNQSPI